MIYAIGDIHGQKEMLDHNLALIEKDGGKDAHIVFLGDYTDRGLNSRAVIDTIMEGLAAGRNWTPIKGNHDQMFVNYIRDGNEHDERIAPGLSWVNPRLGGTNTLVSYGLVPDDAPVFDQPEGDLERLVQMTIDGQVVTAEQYRERAIAAVPQDHLDFLDTLPLTYETEDKIFVHAGLRAGVALADQDPQDLMWIREGFLETNHDFGKLVVHGHTAIDLPMHYGTRVNLDAGAGRGRTLIPAVFEGRACWTLTESGRVPLVPDATTS